jgi:hypothetical protein
MGVARRAFITIDCADPAPLAEFWAAMLCWHHHRDRHIEDAGARAAVDSPQ